MNEELQALHCEFVDWCVRNDIPEEGDAEDLLHNPKMTPEERQWLSDFITRWDEATAKTRKR
jgi:hypothetical protein